MLMKAQLQHIQMPWGAEDGVYNPCNNGQTLLLAVILEVELLENIADGSAVFFDV